MNLFTNSVSLRLERVKQSSRRPIHITEVMQVCDLEPKISVRAPIQMSQVLSSFID